jgi:predicted enzyme related to lactoylglutathione lyase
MAKQEKATDGQFLGLRTVIYAAQDLPKARDWYAKVLGFKPYFDEPFYVGFEVGGYELGLDPNAPPSKGPGGPVTYWGVPNADAGLAHLVAQGAEVVEAVHEVGGGIRVAQVRDPFGNILGVIENPHFKGGK